jgi:hypothetical protein
MPTEQDKDAEILKLKEIIIGQSKVILEYQKLCFKQLTGREFGDLPGIEEQRIPDR